LGKVGLDENDNKLEALWFEVNAGLVTPDGRALLTKLTPLDMGYPAAAKMMRDFAAERGVASCPFADRLDFDVLCTSETLEDELNVLDSFQSPVARDVLSQPAPNRAAYIDRRARDVFIDPCPMSPRMR
jgi:hypothetical protein